MIKLHFGRFFKIPFRLRQRVAFIGNNGELMDGIVDSIDINFLNSGKAVDIDFIVHPIIDGNESSTAEFFSDYEVNKRIFANRRKGKKFLNEQKRKAQK